MMETFDSVMTIITGAIILIFALGLTAFALFVIATIIRAMLRIWE